MTDRPPHRADLNHIARSNSSLSPLHHVQLNRLLVHLDHIDRSRPASTHPRRQRARARHHHPPPVRLPRSRRAPDDRARRARRPRPSRPHSLYPARGSTAPTGSKYRRAAGCGGTRALSGHPAAPASNSRLAFAHCSARSAPDHRHVARPRRQRERPHAVRGIQSDDRRARNLQHRLEFLRDVPAIPRVHRIERTESERRRPPRRVVVPGHDEHRRAARRVVEELPRALELARAASAARDRPRRRSPRPASVAISRSTPSTCAATL